MRFGAELDATEFPDIIITCLKYTGHQIQMYWHVLAVGRFVGSAFGAFGTAQRLLLENCIAINHTGTAATYTICVL